MGVARVIHILAKSREYCEGAGLCIGCRLARCGSISPRLTRCGSVSPRLARCGSVTPRLALCGSVTPFTVPFP